jgi:hypothetical protein
MVQDHSDRRDMRAPDGWLEVLVKEVPFYARICPSCIVPEPRIASVSRKGLSGLWLCGDLSHEKP